MEYELLVNDIERFVEAKREEPKVREGVIIEIGSIDKTISVRLSEISDRQTQSFFPGSLVSLNNERAEIIDTYGKIIKLELKEGLNEFKLGETVEIDSNLTNVIINRLKKTIDKVKEKEIKADTVRILNLITGKGKPTYDKEKIRYSSKTLNENQIEAVLRSLEARDFHLIMGPPGTGKTYVIVELAQQLIKRKQKVLITAWTNLAVDNMVEQLVKKTKKVLRIGQPNEIGPKIKKYSLFERIKYHRFWKEVKKLGRLIENSFKRRVEIKEKLFSIRKEIDQLMNDRNRFQKEIEKLIKEKEEYEKLIIDLNKEEHKPNELNIVREKILKIEKRANSCLDLSKKLFELNKQSKLFFYKLEDLEKELKKIRLKLFSKRVLSIFSTRQKKKAQELYKRCNEKKNFLEKYYNYLKLKEFCKERFDNLYPKTPGNPDQEALNLELQLLDLFNNCLRLEEKKLQRETLKESKEINLDIYNEYMKSLERKIELLTTKIKCLNAEIHIEMNYRESLEREIKNLTESLERYKKEKYELEKEIVFELILNAKVIAATAIYSSHPFLDEIFFDSVIIDEASQIAGYMSLLPLTKCKKFILVGDDRQLQPIEEEKIPKELSLSIFNRMVKLYPSFYTFLATQYRMNEKIASISSSLFYENKLKTFKNIRNLTLRSPHRGDHKILRIKDPVTFLDTSRVCFYEEGVGSGCRNIKEAKLVTKIVSLFLRSGFNPTDIGVITPYRKQKAIIQKYIQKFSKDIEVGTVYGYQGREKEIIIISFARSLSFKGPFPKYRLKFIEKPTQINVALTRAKKKLIIIGNSKTLYQSDLLKRIIDLIGKKNIIIL